MKKLVFNIFYFLSVAIPLWSQEYNILDYGAVGDGKSINTVQIQMAINDASQNGGGRVVVPSGEFVSGSIFLKTGVDLHLEEGSILLGATDPIHYHKLNWLRALIMCDSQRNVSISGKGTVDGRGRALALHIDSLFYAGKIDSSHYNLVDRRPTFRERPQLVEFVNSQNIRLTGVTLKNAAFWVTTFHLCNQVVVDSLQIDSDAYWNNDGIDISDSRNVRITNCNINSSDDGICLKSHSETVFCDSIYIANCTIRSSASAVKLGTRSSAGFKNVRIENIRVYDTYRSAIALESVDGGILENIWVENIEAVNTGNAIFIRLGKRTRYTTRTSTAILRNVTIKNLKVEVPFARPDYAYELRGPSLPFFHNTFPASITGIPGHYVENVRLENIHIDYPGKGNKGLAYSPLSRLDKVPEKISDYPEFSMFGELPAWGLYVRHVKGLSLKNISLGIADADYRPAVVFDDVHQAELNNIQIIGDTKKDRFILFESSGISVDEPTLVTNQDNK